MKTSKFVKNSVFGIKKYAKYRGYKVKYYADDVNFYSDIYKIKWFGLNNELIKSYFGVWDEHEYNFAVVWEAVREFIMIKCDEDNSKKLNKCKYD